MGEDKKRLVVAVFAFILLVSAASPVIRPISFLYPVVPLLLIGFILVFRNELRTPEALKILFIMLPFGIWASLTAFWSYYPAVSLIRGGYYIFLVAGLVAVTIALRENRISLFQLLFGLNLVIAAVAVFSLLTGIPSDSWSGGNAKGFMGFFAHQNSLGASLLFTFPGWLYLFLEQRSVKIADDVAGKQKKTKTSRLVFLVSGVLLNLMLITLTYSRASLLSLFLMLLLFGLCSVSRSFSKKLFILSGSVALFFVLPLLASQFQLPPGKNSVTEGISFFWLKQGESFMSTREQLFKDSWRAAEYGSIFGIGYGVSHPKITNEAAGSYYNEDERYIREKGNSFLALVEETGMVGLLLILVPIGLLLLNNKHFKGNLNKTHSELIYLAILMSFIFHAQFEAWMAGIASIYLFILMFFLISALSHWSTGN